MAQALAAHPDATLEAIFTTSVEYPEAVLSQIKYNVMRMNSEFNEYVLCLTEYEHQILGLTFTRILEKLRDNTDPEVVRGLDPWPALGPHQGYGHGGQVLPGLQGAAQHVGVQEVLRPLPRPAAEGVANLGE